MTSSLEQELRGSWPDSDIDTLNSQQMKEWGESHAMEMRYPAPNELLLDIDTEEQYRTFKKNLHIEAKQIGIVSDYQEMKSKTGDEVHRYIVVTLNRPVESEIERFMLQACLGSDPTREILSYYRYLQKDPHPTMLARPILIDTKKGELK